MSSLKIRIYFEDTDAQGVVYNSNYLKFLERGRTEFLREIGYDQKQLLDNDIIFVVKKVSLDFIKPAELDDIIEVRSKIFGVKNVTFSFYQEVLDSNGFKILTADVKCGCLETNYKKPTKVPTKLLNSMMEKSNGI